MVNTLFDPGWEGFLRAEISWNVATIKASAVRGYTFTAAHQFVSDATGAGAVLVSTCTLASKGTTAGVASAADNTWVAVPAGAAIDVVLIYQASAVTGGGDVAASAQRLIAFIDNATNLPFTPIGIDVALKFAPSGDRIFRL